MGKPRKQHKIEVSIRIRPPATTSIKKSGNGKHIDDKECEESDLELSQIDIIDNDIPNNSRKSASSLSINGTPHAFDHIITPDSNQEDCFEAAASRLMLKIQQGYSCCLMAYGQTGSGKTYSIFGPPGVLTETDLQNAQKQGFLVPESWGIFPRVAIQLFELLKAGKKGVNNKRKGPYENSSNNKPSSFQVSVVEVYQNRAFDLLNDRKLLSVGTTRSQGRDLGNGVFHPSSCYCKRCIMLSKHQPRKENILAAREIIRSHADVARLSRTVELSRISKGHLLNERSSRSHCLVQIYLSLSEDDGKTTKNPTFMFVDLAGSERMKKSGVDGTRSKEATVINSSLTVLGRVIQALGKKSSSDTSCNYIHVPYRDSTLTMLLQPVFTDRACASVIVNVSSESEHLDETMGSLKFAKRLSNVKFQERAVVGYDNKDRKISLEKELKEARRKLKAMDKQNLGGHIGIDVNPSDRRTFEINIDKLKCAQESVIHLRSELNEAEAKSKSKTPSSTSTNNRVIQLQNCLLKAKSDLDVIDGIVMRQKTIKGLWIEPTFAYSKVKSEVQRLETALALVTLGNE